MEKSNTCRCWYFPWIWGSGVLGALPCQRSVSDYHVRFRNMPSAWFLWFHLGWIGPGARVDRPRFPTKWFSTPPRISTKWFSTAPGLPQCGFRPPLSGHKVVFDRPRLATKCFSTPPFCHKVVSTASGLPQSGFDRPRLATKWLSTAPGLPHNGVRPPPV